jgi:hypothetical protein
MYNYVMVNAAKRNQSIARISSMLHSYVDFRLPTYDNY